MADLRDQVVVITGGSAGVGRATANAFAREGAKVAVLARGRDRLDETVRELEARGTPATSVQVGSALSDRSIPLQSAYCGAKHAIRGFTDSLRSELIHDNSNVHVTMVRLPGMNTPQFDWCKSLMPRKAQPVPPIYQPETAAEAIVHAVTHRQREYYVGWPTVESIWGNKFIAGWLDRHLARTNYQAQQTDVPEDPSRPKKTWCCWCRS